MFSMIAVLFSWKNITDFYFSLLFYWYFLPIYSISHLTLVAVALPTRKHLLRLSYSPKLAGRVTVSFPFVSLPFDWHLSALWTCCRWEEAWCVVNWYASCFIRARFIREVSHDNTFCRFRGFTAFTVLISHLSYNQHVHLIFAFHYSRISGILLMSEPQSPSWCWVHCAAGDTAFVF